MTERDLIYCWLFWRASPLAYEIDTVEGYITYTFEEISDRGPGNWHRSKFVIEFKQFEEWSEKWERKRSRSGH